MKPLQAGGPALLAFVGDAAQAQALGALRQVVVVAAAVAHQLGMVEMQDGFRHRVQELGVVGDQHHRAGIGRQPFLQPQHGVQVQVVGGFVQQQQLGRRHQRARQRQAHAPAAGVALHRLHPFLRLEAQAGQQLLGARGRAPGAGFHQRRLGLGDLRSGRRPAARRACSSRRWVSPSMTNSRAGRSSAWISCSTLAMRQPAGRLRSPASWSISLCQEREQRRLAGAVLPTMPTRSPGYNKLGAVQHLVPRRTVNPGAYLFQLFSGQ